MKPIHEDKSPFKSKTGSEPSNSISPAAKARYEWFYRIRSSSNWKEPVPQFLDFEPTKFDMKIFGQHKTSEALLRILCKLERISTRTARRYKSQGVQ